jgi:hypothetical protein
LGKRFAATTGRLFLGGLSRVPQKPEEKGGVVADSFARGGNDEKRKVSMTQFAKETQSKKRCEIGVEAQYQRSQAKMLMKKMLSAKSVYQCNQVKV